MKKFLYGALVGLLGAIATAVAWFIVQRRGQELQRAAEIRVIRDLPMNGVKIDTEALEGKIQEAREKLANSTKEAIKAEFMARFGVKP